MFPANLLERIWGRERRDFRYFLKYGDDIVYFPNWYAEALMLSTIDRDHVEVQWRHRYILTRVHKRTGQKETHGNEQRKATCPGWFLLLLFIYLFVLSTWHKLELSWKRNLN